SASFSLSHPLSRSNPPTSCPLLASEGGVQRKQLPYSVETPYGFHLDLDFLKYVDDIEKGNTIKRVHIQRRVKGPPKFSTLPRNFSLPGNGARPASKENDSTWASEGGTSGQSSRGTTSQGSGYVSAKPRDEMGAGARGVEEKAVGIQSRPNLLRASSMPITLQQRKGSDSSSPDRIVGTPENGSTENMFRASPDITERRCVPQERTGLHQQITVALKRVRELEEQVKTIPELKAQICSLREEREQLLLQLKARTQTQISTSPSTIAPSSDAGTHTQPPGHRPLEGLNLALMTQPTGVTEKTEGQTSPPQLQAASVRARRGSGETEAQQPLTKPLPKAQVQDAPQLEAQSPTQLSEQQVKHEAPSEDKSQAKKPTGDVSKEKSQPQAETQSPSPGSSAAQTRPKSIQAQPHSQSSATRRNSKELKAPQRGSTVSQPPSRGGEAQTRPTRQGSSDVQLQSQGSRRSSSETQPPHKDASETPSLRRGSSETAQRRGSREVQASGRDTGEAQPPRRGSSESPTSPAALGQVVTRLTGLLGEQWAQLGSSSGTQQMASQQEMVLYQEWFRVSSQKDSQADTVTLYLRQVGSTTPTLLPYVVNLTDGNGNMALHYSVSHSNFPVVKLLLDTGLCETDNVNKAGYTPVMLAALTAADSPDDLEVAQQLLRLGDVNARSRQAGQTALMLAVSHGRVAMVKLLLSCGADVNAQDREGSTALMCASEHGHTHIARLLLETGRCDSGLRDKNNQTALSVAEGASQQEIVDLLKANTETQASEPPSTTDLI
uniref:KN motif and ankyrin repeat domains 4 n=1 Tax=Seriola lalandi dorsalis TaxID=1841481 RepID=A0A3B4WDC1_SERLL